MSLLIALSFAGLLVQSPAATPTASIAGRVVEDGTNKPIEGVHITLIQSRFRPGPFIDRPRTAVTDRDGHYDFGGLDAGRYRINVQKGGFAPLVEPGLPEVELAAGQHRANVNVVLQKGAVIVGRVLDEKGEPLSDMRVMAMRKPPATPTGIPAPDFPIPSGPGTQTNDLGEFRLFSLPPGEYCVQAAPRFDFNGSSAARGTTMLVTYFPSTPDVRAAHPINVAAGQTSDDVAIRMVTVPAFQVSGVVMNEAGRPIVNAMVRLVGDESPRPPIFMGGPGHQTRTDKSGRFSFEGATNGSYMLLAIAPVVVTGPRDRGAGHASGGGAFTSWGGSSGGMVGGRIGGGVTMETSSDGTTIEYRDDNATRVPVSINQTNVSGLEVIVRRAAR